MVTFVAMETIQAIRRANLRLLLEEVTEGLGKERGSAAELAARTGVKAPYISQILNDRLHSGGAPRTIGDDAARKLERGMNKPAGWMDHHHDRTRDSTELEMLRVYRLLTPAQRAHLIESGKLFLGDPGEDSPSPGSDQPGVRH